MVYLRRCLQYSESWFLLSGLGLGLGFIWPVFWWLVFPAVAGFFYAVEKSPSLLRAAMGGLMAFTIKMGFSLGWIWTTYPIEWIDLGLGNYELLVIGFYWFTLALAVAASGAFLAIALKYLHAFGRSLRIISSAFLWLGAELLGALFFSLITFGAGGSVNALFSFGMAGNHLADHVWLLQFARVGGVFSLTLVAVLAGRILFEFYHLLQTRRALTSAGLVGVLLLLTATVIPPWSAQSLPGTVAVIDTAFGGSDFFSLSDQERLKQIALSEAVQAAVLSGADYIILPEGAATVAGGTPTFQAYKEFRSAYNDPKAVVVESVRTPTSLTEVAMRGRVYDGGDKVAYSIDKQRLVPQGEFMPNFYLLVMRALGFGEAVATIEGKLNYRPGPYASQADLPSHLPSILFCYAEADPLSVRRFSSERDVPFVVHPISHAWFNSPESLWHQYDSMRKIHAVWNQVSVVSAGNMTKGAWYTTSGTKVFGRRVAEGDRWTVSLVP